MSLASVESYLQQELKHRLTRILGLPYIIKEQILRDLPTQIVDEFIDTFCLDGQHKGIEIPVTFTFPQNQQPPKAFILIQYKGGTEQQSALGSMMGKDNNQDGKVLKEHCLVEKKAVKNGVVVAVIKTKKPIYKVLNLTNVSNNLLDYANVQDNQITLPWYDVFEGNDFYVDVWYAKVDEDSQGNLKKDIYQESIGMTVLETYTIDTVSLNQDTLRCLDMLIRSILLLLRFNSEEQVSFALQNVIYQGTDLLDGITTANNSYTGTQLYTRRVEINYTVPYTMSLDFVKKIEHIKSVQKTGNDKIEGVRPNGLE